MAKSNKLPVADTAPMAYKTTKADIQRERRWKAEDALRVCQSYQENMKDKQLMKDVKTVAREKMKELKKVV